MLLLYVWVCSYGVMLFEVGGELVLFGMVDMVVWVVVELCWWYGLFLFWMLDVVVWQQCLGEQYCDGGDVVVVVGVVESEVDLDWLMQDMLEVIDLLDVQDDVLVICMINVLLVQVVCDGVSDLYIELFEIYLVVCYWVDGMLCDMVQFWWVLYVVLVLCIKIMVYLDIVEKWLLQDGCIVICVGGWLLDICVFIVLIGYGECVVL